MKLYRSLIACLVAGAVLTGACVQSSTKKTGKDGKQASPPKVPEKPIRKDSPLLKIKPDFMGFDWKAPRTIPKGDFSKERVYFFMVDRFCNGDTSNDYNANPKDMRAWHGGDLKGATSKLQYIKDLGFSAIWISPIVDNDEPPAGGHWWFYHGYHFKDPYTVDEHFGSNADYKAFVATAHKLGLKVLQDVVINHSGHTFPLRPERKKEFAPWFHFPFKDIKNYFDEKESVQHALLGAPDFNQRNKHAAAFLMDYVKFWIQTANIDGLRIDTVKHVYLDFWPKFVKEMKSFAGPGFFLMGEVWESQLYICKKYMNQGKLDSLIDFPLYYKLEQVFTKDGNMNELSKALQQDKQWNQPNNLGVFVDNHDVCRFSRASGKYHKEYLKSGLAFIYTIRGFPVVYYGTEVMMKGTGNKDWQGREMMPWTDIEAGKYKDMIDHVKSLNDLKANSPALHNGAHTEVYKDYSVYAYIRSVKGDAVLAIINKQPEDSKYVFRLPAAAGFRGTISDLLSGQKFTVRGNTLSMTLKARQSYIFRSRKAAALAPKTVAFNTRMPKGIKLVTFKIKKPDAREVILAGAFNGWDQKSMKLKKQPDGTFSITIPLKPGSYEYKFIVDGQWTKDPNEQKNSGPPYGNSIIIIK